MPTQPVYEDLGVYPALSITDPTGSYVINSMGFSAVAKGGTSVIQSIKISNPSIGSAAQQCLLLVKTTWGANSGTAPVDEGWVQARCTTFGDIEFSTVDNLVGKPIGYSPGIQDIPYGQYSSVDLKINIPADAEGRIYHIYLDVIFTYY
jgi:hypothetical protein